MFIWRGSGGTLLRAVRRNNPGTILEHLLIVGSDGLTRLFKEIREKDKIDDLSMEYKKFAEWLRIE